MTRTLWIIGFLIAIVAFSGFTIICLIALITHRHLNSKGWLMLVLGVYSVWFLFGRLRSAVKCGDPTKVLGGEDSKSIFK